MDEKPRRLPMLLTGMSARLLLLTVFFVMLSEVFIYAPSIGRYRITYMEERIAAAHLASLALEAPSDNRVSSELLEELLKSAKSYGIVLRRPSSKALMLSRNMPPKVHATYDTRAHEFFPLIAEALSVMWNRDRRMIRIVGPSPTNPDVLVETVINEWILRELMLDYSARILLLSVVISLMTATLVYLSLQWLFVRPMLGITDSMVNFRRDPDDARRLIRPSRRRDEIGRAERELAQMQSRLRDALKQRTRLAALGTAVTKINHDLRNILATAQLVSDHVSDSADPNVRRIAPTLLGALDRAVALCSRTLTFANEGTPAPELTHFDLAGLVSDIATEISVRESQTGMIENSVPRDFDIFADRDQLYRVISNLVLNAFQAGATKVSVAASANVELNENTIEIADNGPGLPNKVKEHLFEPFQGSARVGGTGLGLAIARDLMRGHGGDAELGRSGEDGTVFILCLPIEEKRERARFGRPGPSATDQSGSAGSGSSANAAE
jgi:signal transduction histidine kinase